MYALDPIPSQWETTKPCVYRIPQVVDGMMRLTLVWAVPVTDCCSLEGRQRFFAWAWNNEARITSVNILSTRVCAGFHDFQCIGKSRHLLHDSRSVVIFNLGRGCSHCLELLCLLYQGSQWEHHVPVCFPQLFSNCGTLGGSALAVTSLHVVNPRRRLSSPGAW